MKKLTAHKSIYVYAEWLGLSEPIGILHSESTGKKEIFSFEGGAPWLEYKDFAALDPDLGQFSGRQYLRDEKANFGVFLDASPDRWGRMLIKRREALSARLEGRRPRTLSESDFLLGVFDGSRMGALRFKLDGQGDFLDNHYELATPPWASIRDLEYASLELESSETNDGPDYIKWLNMLVDPGSSLGGARPKATIVDQEGCLWIAKFPSGRDEKNVGLWEKVVNELAASCGITVPETRAKQFSAKGHTFLTKRFDRTNRGERIHFASAMTMLGEKDGADYSTGISYLNIVEFITRYGGDVELNLEELWRRIVFNIAISNCDDHLRNHGFLLTGSGWILSPAYDMNPDENGSGLKLNISDDDNSLDFDLPFRVIPYFRLPEKKAQSIFETIKEGVRQWRAVAEKYGASRTEMELMEGVFRF